MKMLRVYALAPVGSYLIPGEMETKGDLEKPHPFQVLFTSNLRLAACIQERRQRDEFKLSQTRQETRPHQAAASGDGRISRRTKQMVHSGSLVGRRVSRT